MRRLIAGSVFLIVVLVTFIVGYAVISHPLEYTVNSLGDAYTDLGTSNGWTDIATVNNLAVGLVWMFAISIAVGIGCIFIWFMVYAHKKEYES